MGRAHARGTELDADLIVFATGFDAVTARSEHGRGRGSHPRPEWADGPRTHLGIMVVAFSQPVHGSRPAGPFANIPS